MCPLLPLVMLQQNFTPDNASIDSSIKALYAVISGPIGHKRDWARFRNLFTEKGTLSALVETKAGKKVFTMTVEDYISRNDKLLTERGFYEKETQRKVHHNGNIVQVFSTYESRWKPEDKEPFDKGVNAIQLAYDGKSWKIHSVLWEPAPKK